MFIVNIISRVERDCFFCNFAVWQGRYFACRKHEYSIPFSIVKRGVPTFFKFFRNFFICFYFSRLAGFGLCKNKLWLSAKTA